LIALAHKNWLDDDIKAPPKCNAENYSIQHAVLAKLSYQVTPRNISDRFPVSAVVLSVRQEKRRFSANFEEYSPNIAAPQS
jgi:hypothetical protein